MPNWFFSSLSQTVAFQPGDEINVNCVYRSKSASVDAGSKPTDEMCYGFVAIYPAIDAFTECNQWRSAELCSDIGIRCDLSSLKYYSLSVVRDCAVICSQLCNQTLQAILNTGCLSGDIASFLTTQTPDIAVLIMYAGWCKLTAANSPDAIPSTVIPPTLNCPSTLQPGKFIRRFTLNLVNLACEYR